jgi:predicted dinucleotide-binding enzyme
MPAAGPGSLCQDRHSFRGVREQSECRRIRRPDASNYAVSRRVPISAWCVNTRNARRNACRRTAGVVPRGRRPAGARASGGPIPPGSRAFWTDISPLPGSSASGPPTGIPFAPFVRQAAGRLVAKVLTGDTNMKQRVSIVGQGHVGSALARGLQRAGYDIRTVANDPTAAREAAGWGDIVIFAVPYSAIDAVLDELGSAIDGKIVVDVTNALTADHQLALGFTTSGAEELQRKAPSAKVVKSFNTVFAQRMETGRVKGQPLSLLMASDHAPAKAAVAALGRDIGFDPIDAGPLRNARWLESLGYLNIQLGYVLGMGTEIGFALFH